MAIKKKYNFLFIVCAGVHVCAMDPFKRAWEKHQEERRILFEKLELAMPNETYEEAMEMHRKIIVENDLVMHKVAQQQEVKKNEIVKK